MKTLFYLLFIFGTTWFFTGVVLRAIDVSIQNQDRMLCFSAQKSGNKEYLEKCQCFYKTKEIICLQENSK